MPKKPFLNELQEDKTTSTRLIMSCHDILVPKKRNNHGLRSTVYGLQFEVYGLQSTVYGQPKKQIQQQQKIPPTKLLTNKSFL